MKTSDAIYADFFHEEDLKDKNFIEIENYLNVKVRFALEDRKFSIAYVIKAICKYHKTYNIYIVKYSIINDRIKLLDCLHLTPEDTQRYSLLL